MKSSLLVVFLVSACVSKGISSRSPSSSREDGYVKTSAAGAIFVRDNSYPEFGEAYRDPSNLIWGDAILAKDGSPWVTHFYADRYCYQHGGRLPYREDFTRLENYLGKDAAGRASIVSTSGEVILPHFGEGEFWTSDVPGFYAYKYNPATGKFTSDARSTVAYARCVTNRIKI